MTPQKPESVARGENPCSSYLKITYISTLLLGHVIKSHQRLNEIDKTDNVDENTISTSRERLRSGSRSFRENQSSTYLFLVQQNLTFCRMSSSLETTRRRSHGPACWMRCTTLAYCSPRVGVPSTETTRSPVRNPASSAGEFGRTCFTKIVSIGSSILVRSCPGSIWAMIPNYCISSEFFSRHRRDEILTQQDSGG